MRTIRQGTIGKTFTVHTKKNLAGASMLKLRFVEPDQVTLHEFTTGITTLTDTDPTSPTYNQQAIMQYTDAAGIFPAASDVGVWKLIAACTIGGLTDYSSPAGRFRCLGANE